MAKADHTPEPTYIRVRERPRAIWIFAAAALGALGALGAVRLARLAPTARPTTAAEAPPPAALQLPSPAVVLPAATGVVAPAPARPPVPEATVIRFGDDQGVAINVHAPAPRKPARTAPTSLPVAAPVPELIPAPQPPVPAEPARKRVLTPEQELAQAQLKASMR